MTTSARIQEGDGDPRHGTRNGYGNLGCRCRPCTEAHAVAHKEYTHRSGRSLPHEVARAIRRADREHGTESSYRLGCHCRLCMDAASFARWERRQRTGR